MDDPTVRSLGRQMVELERVCLELERAGRLDEAHEVWRHRDEMQHTRSLLMRRIWAEHARRLLRVL